MHPPPTISCMSLLVRSLPIDPVDGRPFADVTAVGNGGTDIVKWLGDTDASVEPEKRFANCYLF